MNKEPSPFFKLPESRETCWQILHSEIEKWFGPLTVDDGYQLKSLGKLKMNWEFLSQLHSSNGIQYAGKDGIYGISKTNS